MERDETEGDVNDSEDEKQMMDSIRERTHLVEGRPLRRVHTGFSVDRTSGAQNFLQPMPEIVSALFDRNKMANFIINEMNNKGVAGYSYAIAQNGRLVDAAGKGDARVASDNQKDMIETTRMVSASLAKPACAVAMMKFLEEYPEFVDLETSAYSKAWIVQNNFPDVHNSIKNITIYQLLTHTSGLNGPTRLSEFGEVLKNPAVPVSNSGYHNANYWFLAYLIQSITSPEAGVAGSFVNYVKNMLKQEEYEFTAVTNKVDSNPCLYYKVGDLSNGASWGDYPDNCGAAGWYASAVDWAAFLVFFRYYRFISKKYKDMMINDPKKIFGFVKFPGQARGTYYGHNGLWRKTSGKGFRGGVMAFPDGIDSSLLTNTNGAINTMEILIDAYEAAF